MKGFSSTTRNTVSATVAALVFLSLAGSARGASMPDPRVAPQPFFVRDLTNSRRTEPPMNVSRANPAPAAVDQQTALSLVGQRIAAYLANLRTLIERSQTIASQTREDLVAELNSDISWLQRESIGVARAETLKSADGKSRAIRDFWKQKRNRINYYIATIISGRVRGTIEKLESIETKTSILIERLQAAGGTIESITQRYNEMVRHLNEARAHFRTAEGHINALNTSQNESSMDSFTAAQSSLRAAHTSLREARGELRLLMSELSAALPAAENKQATTGQNQ